jgi:hypothetical protein
MSDTRRVELRPFILALLASTAVSYPGEAAEVSGTTVRVSVQAQADGEGGVRILRAPGNIFQGDIITTDRAGEAQIRFRDDSRFVVGPNSRVTIDEFVFNPNGTATQVGLSAARGAFRFIGGRSNDQAYQIRTPTATIGIRGTALDLAVNSRGGTVVYWREGTGWICLYPQPIPRQQDCRDMVRGDFAVMPPGGGFAFVTRAEGLGLIEAMLPYTDSQDTLAPEFRLPPAPPPRFANRAREY